MDLTPFLPEPLTLRLATANDQSFLLQLFTSSRPMFSRMGMPETLAEQQFQLQQLSYRQQAPGAGLFILLLRNSAIGQLMLDHSKHEICLMDLSIQLQHRGQGYGTALITAAQALASQHQLPLTLSVDCANPGALALYLRLGFVVTQQQAFHYRMFWQCSHPQIR